MKKKDWKTNLALELTMQDVMDNMEELSTMEAYQFTPCDFEILFVEPINEGHSNQTLAKQANH